jgi:hypothetical protein
VPEIVGQTADVVADNENVYWINDGDQGPGKLSSCKATDCANTASLLYSGTLLWNLIENGQDLYFIEGGPFGSTTSSSVLARCAKTGCPSGATVLQYSGTPYSVGGRLSGLPGGTSVTLRDNGGDDKTLSADGFFTFPTALPSGTPYGVTIRTQPSGATCSVWGGSGTVGYGAVTSVLVNCSPASVSIGGTLSGWLTGSVVLQNNGGDNLTLNGDGTFAFGTTVASGTPYAVSVVAKPADETCVVTGGSGVASTNVSSVTVTCTEGVQSGLVSDGQYLYWVTNGFSNGSYSNGAVMRMPVGGGAPAVLASGLPNVFMASAAVDTNYLYFASYKEGTINRVPLAGGPVSPVATGQSQPTSLVLSGTRLYWATSNEVVTLDLGADAGAPVPLATSPATNPNVIHFGSPRRIAIDAGFLYWVSLGDTDNGPVYTDSVGKVPLSGGAAQPLVTGQFQLGGGIGSAGGRVFFTGYEPTLMSVAE